MSSRSFKKQSKIRKLTDADFVKKYLECEESQAELARQIHVTRQAIGDRLKRIGREVIEAARQAGKVSVLSAKKRAVKEAAFEAGRQDGIRTWSYYEAADQVLRDQLQLADQIKAEIAEWMAVPGRKLKPYQVQMLLMTQAGILKSCQVQHRLRADLYNFEGSDSFFATVLNLFMQEQPEARVRLYRELERRHAITAEIYK